MAGNVWEFVNDGAGSESRLCVMHGGSYKNSGDTVKATLRLSGIDREYREHDFGMRCAQIPDTADGNTSYPIEVPSAVLT